MARYAPHMSNKILLIYEHDFTAQKNLPVTLTEAQKGESGNRLGIRPEDLNQVFPNNNARIEVYTSYVQRANAWAATQATQERLAMGKLLEALETLTPPVILETDENRQTGVPLREAHAAESKLTGTRWYVLEALVRLLATFTFHICAPPCTSLQSQDVHADFKYNMGSPDVFTWDDQLAESNLNDLAAENSSSS